MTKKMHPVDIRDRERVAAAVKYNVHQRRGPHFKINEPAATLADAAGIAERVSAENGRPCLVYGILEDGTAVMVPQDMVAAARGEVPVAIGEVGISTSEVAQLSAILTGGGMKRANSKETAVKRFLNLAAERGIDAPYDFLGGPFARCAELLRARVAPKTDNAPKAAAAIADKASDGAAPANAGDYPAPTKKTRSKPTDTELNRRARRAPAPAATPAESGKPATGKRAAILEAAQRGELPTAPDFSAETHRRYRAKLAEIVDLANAGKIEELKAFPINPISSSPQAMDRYRNLCVIALEAQAAKSAVA